jgi:hypothetical protein
VAGPFVFSGYHNKPAETAEAFAELHGTRWAGGREGGREGKFCCMLCTQIATLGRFLPFILTFLLPLPPSLPPSQVLQNRGPGPLREGREGRAPFEDHRSGEGALQTRERCEGEGEGEGVRRGIVTKEAGGIAGPILTPPLPHSLPPSQASTWCPP